LNIGVQSATLVVSPAGSLHTHKKRETGLSRQVEIWIVCYRSAQQIKENPKAAIDEAGSEFVR
jgi:hypothetical protein